MHDGGIKTGTGYVDPSSLDPVTSAGYNINLPITLAGGLSGLTTDDVAITATGILPTGAGDLLSFVQGMDIQFQNFDQLFQLRGFSVADLLNGIVTVIDGIIDSGILDDEIQPNNLTSRYPAREGTPNSRPPPRSSTRNTS